MSRRGAFGSDLQSKVKEKKTTGLGLSSSIHEETRDDSDVEMDDAADRHNNHGEDNGYSQDDDDHDGDDDDEDEDATEALHRLAANYRRYSSSQNRFQTEQDDDDNNNQEESDILMNSVYSEIPRSTREAGSNTNSHSNSRPRDAQNDSDREGHNTDSDNYNSDDHEGAGNHDEHEMSAAQLLNTIFGGARMPQSLGGGRVFEQLLGRLRQEEDPYMMMEIMNDISARVLMTSGFMAERIIPAYNIAKAAVNILNNPLLEDDFQLQIAACRCLYNIPQVDLNFVHDLVSAGAIDALKAKLLEISYIDLAEQALQTLEIIASVRSREILSRDCLSVCLSHIDFFTVHTQRKALVIAASACDHAPKSSFDSIKSVFPIIENVACEYSDSACLESAWLCISRIIESFGDEPKYLEELISSRLLGKLMEILPDSLKNGEKNNSVYNVSFKVSSRLIESLAIIANSSPKLSLSLIKDCDIGKMIVSSLTNSAEVKPGTGFSVESLMFTPNEIGIVLLKLVNQLLPAVSFSLQKHEDLIDIGGFRNLNLNDSRACVVEQKTKLYLDTTENCEAFEKFVERIFQVLLMYYSASVNYQISRLILMAILRIIKVSSPSQIEQYVSKTSLPSILASVVIEGKKLFDSGDIPSSSDSLKPLVLIYGALLICDALLTKNPGIYVTEFKREGMIHYIGGFIISLEKTLAVTRAIAEDVNNNIEVDVKSDEEDAEVEEDDNENDNEDDSEEEDEIEEVIVEEDEDDEGDDNEEAEEDDEDEEDDDDDEEDEEDDDESSGRSAFSDFRSSSSTVFGQSLLRDASLNQDYTHLIKPENMFESLLRLCVQIREKYESSKNKFSYVDSKNAILLGKIKNAIDDKSQRPTTFEDWCQIWKTLASALDYSEEGGEEESISIFDLLDSGIVDSLVSFFSGCSSLSTEVESFRYIICSVYGPLHKDERVPLMSLVEKLEEALARTESFELVLSNFAKTSGSSSVSSFLKQITLKFVSTDPTVSEQNSALLLKVHAIASFTHVDAFIRSRMQGMRELLSVLSNSSISTADEYHIEFSINGEVIPHEATIYGAIYRSLQESPNKSVLPNKIWEKGPHVVNFRKVNGPAPKPKSRLENTYSPDVVDESIETLDDDVSIKILELLNILHDFNSSFSDAAAASDALFFNYKLTAKLKRQLEEPLVVASGALPNWTVAITKNYPFLFPIDTRVFFLQSTSFGYSRLINYWQSRLKEGESNRSVGRLGRTVRHKLRLSRKSLFQGAIKILEEYGTVPGLIDIEYFDEAGTGLGPTLEFYAEVSKEFSRSKLGMWRENESEKDTKYLNYPTGLFPRPLKHDSHTYHKIIYMFSILGTFVSRSLFDSKLIDFNFNSMFFELAHMINSPRKKQSRRELIGKVSVIDPMLSNSLKFLLAYVEEYPGIPVEKYDSVEVGGSTLKDLALTFILPGYEDIDLIPGGSEVEVDSSNVEDYIDKVIDLTLFSGVEKQVTAFVEGFSKVFPYSSMEIFSPKELVNLLGNSQEDWSFEIIMDFIKADHGYTKDSISVIRLAEIMSEFSVDERRKFLQFLTGSPKLPIGGFKSLVPQLTIVLKHAENGLEGDDYLPSVMTCANYLKLPNYSSKEVMKKRIEKAMNEGAGAFLLS